MDLKFVLDLEDLGGVPGRLVSRLVPSHLGLHPEAKLVGSNAPEHWPLETDAPRDEEGCKANGARREQWGKERPWSCVDYGTATFLGLGCTLAVVRSLALVARSFRCGHLGGVCICRHVYVGMYRGREATGRGQHESWTHTGKA